MSLGLLDDYGSDSGSEEPPDSPDGTGDGEGDRSKDKLKLDVQPSNPTDATIKTCVHVSNTGKEKKVVDDEGIGNTDSPRLTLFGLSGEGDTLDTDTSDSDTSGEDEEEGDNGGEIARERSPLPLPVLDGSDTLASSVFSNPYREAEAARLAVLTQHVGLSEPPPRKEGRKRSRGRGKGGRQRDRPRSEPGQGGGDSNWTDGDSPVGMGGGRGGRKHRSGVTESLQPPRKYLKTHTKIRHKEQPWTAQ
jgi:hypothetical protein